MKGQADMIDKKGGGSNRRTIMCSDIFRAFWEASVFCKVVIN
jgi:hypothetical protein